MPRCIQRCCKLEWRGSTRFRGVSLGHVLQLGGSSSCCGDAPEHLPARSQALARLALDTWQNHGRVADAHQHVMVCIVTTWIGSWAMAERTGSHTSTSGLCPCTTEEVLDNCINEFLALKFLQALVGTYSTDTQTMHVAAHPHVA